MCIVMNKRQLKAQAHGLKPVVMIGNKGLTPAVLLEIEQALQDHELIKVKIRALKLERQQMCQKIVADTQATLIASIGQVATFYRENEDQ